MKIKEVIKKLKEGDLNADVWVYGTDGNVTKNLYFSFDDKGDVIIYENEENSR